MNVIRLSDLMRGWDYERHPAGCRAFSRAAKRRWRLTVSAHCKCGAAMMFGALQCKHPRAATIDHIKARGLGGADHPSNMTVVCFTCNNAKSFAEAKSASGCKVPAHVRWGWSAAATQRAFEEEAALLDTSQPGMEPGTGGMQPNSSIGSEAS